MIKQAIALSLILTMPAMACEWDDFECTAQRDRMDRLERDSSLRTIQMEQRQDDLEDRLERQQQQQDNFEYKQEQDDNHYDFLDENDGVSDLLYDFNN